MNPKLSNLIEESAAIFIFSDDLELGFSTFKEICRARIQTRDSCAALLPQDVDPSPWVEVGGLVMQHTDVVTPISFIDSVARMDVEGVMMIDPEAQSAPIILKAFSVGMDAASVILVTQQDRQSFFSSWKGTVAEDLLASGLQCCRVLLVAKSGSDFSVKAIEQPALENGEIVFHEHQPQVATPHETEAQRLARQTEFAKDFARVQGNLVFSPDWLAKWPSALARCKFQEVGQTRFPSGKMITASAIMDLRPYVRGTIANDEGVIQVPSTTCEVQSYLASSNQYRDGMCLSFVWQKSKGPSVYSVVCLRALDRGSDESGFFLVDKQVLGVFDLNSFKSVIKDESTLDDFKDLKVMGTEDLKLIDSPIGLITPLADRQAAAIIEYDDQSQILGLYIFVPDVFQPEE